MFIAAKYEEMYAPEIGKWMCIFYRIYISLKPPWYLHHPDLSLRVGRKAVNNKNSARSASLDDFRFLLGNWPGIFFSPQFFCLFCFSISNTREIKIHSVLNTSNVVI